ncbi:MAG: hypothetical protein JXK93_07360 [Sphaerochaetaceae bacterium]|nr:hypothetical protein [Sphaerochaetaceae bacterium]
MNETNTLFEGILDSARKEANRIRESCDRECAQLKAEYESKKAALKQSEEEWIRKKQAEVYRIGEADRMQVRRENEIDVNRQLRRESETALMKHMEALQETDIYRRAVVSWIAEGIIALDRDEVLLTHGAAETVDETMIQQAVDLAQTITGHKVSLTVNERKESSQGVILWSADEKIAYNNLVKTRLERSRSEFENLLEGELWAKQ